MPTLTFNRAHKNGWYSYKLTGVPGAVFIDGRMLTDEGKENLPQTLDINIGGMKEAGADQTEAQRQKAEAKAARDAKKAERAAAQAEKAQERLRKLQEAADKAAARVAKAQPQA
jgi:hypothetical protein